MFRVRNTGPALGARAGVWLALVLLASALVMNTAAIYLVVRDHDLVGFWLARSKEAPASVIMTLDREFDLRLASRLIVSAVLIFAAMVILTMRKTLRRVQLVAEDVFARMDKGVIAVDRRGTITGMNPAAVRILLLDGDHVGKPLAGISSPGVPLAAMVEQIAGRDPSCSDRDFVVERHGHTRRIRADAHVLEDTAGGALGCIIMLSDVSQRHLIEQRMQRIERFQTLGLLASGLVHEIGNPLTALGIHVDLLEERLGEPGGAESAGELIEVLKTEIRRLDGVLEEFRNYADLQTLSVQPTDLVNALERVIRLIRPQATQQGVRVELRQPEPPLPPVPLDPEKFAQVILNLAINALEAMPMGGELAFGAGLRDGAVEVEVADTGPGIAPEIREDLFKPYVTTKLRGTGLGLALTEKLVVQHQGQIDYRTGPQGTSFRMTFPLSPTGDRLP